MYSLISANYKDIEFLQGYLSNEFKVKGYGAEIRAYLDMVAQGNTMVKKLLRGSSVVGFVMAYRDFSLNEGFLAHCYCIPQCRNAASVRLLRKCLKGFFSGMKISVNLDIPEVRATLKNHISKDSLSGESDFLLRL